MNNEALESEFRREPTDNEIEKAMTQAFQKLARIIASDGSAEISKEYLSLLVSEQIRQNRFEDFTRAEFAAKKERERAVKADTLPKDQHHCSEEKPKCQVFFVNIERI